MGYCEQTNRAFVKSALLYANSRSFNTHTQLYSGVRSLLLGLSLCLLPYDMCACKEGSDETVHIHRLV